jgi:hypothetical protein
MRETTGIAIFCDDIRLEIGGKASYMGIYGQDMVIAGTRPALLPKLSIAAHIQIPSEVEAAHLKVAVFRDQDGETEELITVEGDIERPEGLAVSQNTFIQAIVHLNAVPFQITGDCDVKVRAYIDDAECKLGSLPIRFIDPVNE